MAMNKAEKAYVEHLETELAFKRTKRPPFDIIAEDIEGGSTPISGFSYNIYVSAQPNVSEACTTRYFHSKSYSNKTTSREGINLYDTKLKAMRAMRFDAEQQMCQILRKIDLMIQAEILKEDNEED